MQSDLINTFIMQTRIEQRFASLAKEGKKGFVAYITAGDPRLGATEDIIYRLEEAGADIIELGIPFSDPLADGQANQRAAERALAAGVSYKEICEMVARVRTRSEVPLLFFTYMNPLYAQGFDRAVKQAVRVGIDGVLLVDLSLEEAAPYKEAVEAVGMNNVFLVTPTTPLSRIKKIAKQSKWLCLLCFTRRCDGSTKEDRARSEAIGQKY